jgi:hypothetical protein
MNSKQQVLQQQRNLLKLDRLVCLPVTVLY